MSTGLTPTLRFRRLPPSQAVLDVCEQNGEKLEEVEILTLDSMFNSSTVQGLDKCVNLKELSLIGCGISDLEGFPKLPLLRKLELSDNRIAGGLESLADLDSLVELSLGGNKVASVDELKPITGLRIQTLDLAGCPCADDSEEYRQSMFDMFVSLVYLDGMDMDGNEKLIDDEDDEEEDEDDEDEDDEDQFGGGELGEDDEDDDDDIDDDDDDIDDEDDDIDDEDDDELDDEDDDELDEDDDELGEDDVLEPVGDGIPVGDDDDDEDEEEGEELGVNALYGPPLDEDEEDFEGEEEPESEDFDDDEDDDDDDDEEGALKKQRVV